MVKMEFEEIQRFRRPWLWLILLATWAMTVGIFGFGLYSQLKQGKPFGSSPMSNQGLVITALVTFLLVTGLNVLFYKAKLITHIDKRFISYRFVPFHGDFRRIAWKNIREADVVTYRPLRQFGGWGIRRRRRGNAYSVSGNKGLQLVLNSGEKLLIGTSREKELSAFLAGMEAAND